MRNTAFSPLVIHTSLKPKLFFSISTVFWSLSMNSSTVLQLFAQVKVDISKQCLHPRYHGNCIQKGSQELEVKGKIAICVDHFVFRILNLKNVTGREVCGSGVCLGLYYTDSQELILSSESIIPKYIKMTMCLFSSCFQIQIPKYTTAINHLK